MSKSLIPDVVKTAMAQFQLAAEAEINVRTKALDDWEFSIGNQWPVNIQQQRDLEARPCLTINKLPASLRQVTNDARQNRPSIHIAPTDDSTKETAKILEGMVRQIQVASNADIAYDTACDGQTRGGFGYFRVITQYVDEKSFNQEILIKRIKNPFSVYFDPHAIEPDYSDAKWAFIVEDIAREQYKEDYPDSAAGDLDLSSIGDQAQAWMSEDTIRIAEYFKVVEEKQKIYQLAGGMVLNEDELKQYKAEFGENVPILAERETAIRKIKWYKISCTDILDEKDWAGKYIPIIPVLGEDVEFNGKRELVGMVRYAKDPQRMYNYWSSAQTEAIALAPKAPFIAAEGQTEGYEPLWDNANTKTFSTLVYKPTTIDGILVPAPQRMQAEPPIQAMIHATAQASEDMKATTGIYDASLGARSNETSGKAILARQREGDLSNFHYIDNLARAIRHCGVILVDLIPKIYDSARIVRITHMDGTEEMVKINQPTEEKDADGLAKVYDVTTGKYDVVVNIGPSYSTKRQEAAEGMITVTQAFPALWGIAGDLLVKNLDWPGADELAERIKIGLPPQYQEKKDKDPQETMKKLDQSMQMIEQLTAALNEAQAKIETKSQETESKERIAFAQMQNDLIRDIYKTDSGNNIKLAGMELAHLAKRQVMTGINEPFGEVEEPEEEMQEQPMQPQQI